MPPTPDSSPSASGSSFRRFVVAVTTLTLAAMYGWLACYERQAPGDFQWRWHWNGLVWFLLGLGSMVYFWHQVWPPEGRTNALRKDVIKGSLAFALPNLWWLTFPLRFGSDQHFWNLISALIAPVMVAAIDARFVMRLVAAFEKTDADDLKALNSTRADSSAESTKK